VSSGEELAKANLDFFCGELLPQRRSTALHVWPKLYELYWVELAHWLELGASIGFFDKAGIAEVRQSIETHLPSKPDQGSGVVEAEVKVKYVGEKRKDKVRESLRRGDIKEENQIALQSIFRSNMLLTSELMGDAEAVAFLGVVTGLDISSWSKLLDTQSKMPIGLSLETLCGGFARVLAHVEGTISFYPHIGSLGYSNLHMDIERFELRQRREFATMLQEIQTLRLGLNLATRYFEFAGTILSYRETTHGETIDHERQFFTTLRNLLMKWMPPERADFRAFYEFHRFEEKWWLAYSQNLHQTHPPKRRAIRLPNERISDTLDKDKT